MLLKESNLKKPLSPLKVSFIKKPPENGQVESMEDDTDENDYPASSVSDANESGENQLSIGKYIFTMWDFFYLFILIWHSKKLHNCFMLILFPFGVVY